MKPTIKQVNKDGLMLWEVSHGGMARYFKYDWQANFHYEAAVRLYRSRVTGKQGQSQQASLASSSPMRVTAWLSSLP